MIPEPWFTIGLFYGLAVTLYAAWRVSLGLTLISYGITWWLLAFYTLAAGAITLMLFPSQWWLPFVVATLLNTGLVLYYEAPRRERRLL